MSQLIPKHHNPQTMNKEYLKYYIGQRCTVIMYEEGEYIREGEREMIEHPPVTMELSHALLDGYFHSDWVKSIDVPLRPLESMTEEEAMEIAKLATNRILPHYTSDDFHTEKHPCSLDIRFVDDLDTVINIDDNGDVLVYNDGGKTPTIEKRVYNQTKIFHYLIGRGFQLFDLTDKKKEK